MIVFVILTFSVLLNSVQSLNILGVFPYEGKSHFFVFQPYLRELAKRGHNMTIISYFPQKEPLDNYHDISLEDKSEILENYFSIERSYLTILQIVSFLLNTGIKNCEILLADENVQKLWKSQMKFDLVIVEQFNSDCALGLAYQLRVPVVGITSHTLMPWHYDRLGVQYHPGYVSLQFLEGGTKPSLYQRIERTLLQLYTTTIYKYKSQRKTESILAQYFDDVPPLEDLARDIKVMLVYESFVLNGPGLLPPNMRQVGGYHVTTPKPLPDDVRKFIDESLHGVIYISFGSMLRAASTPRHKLDAIVGAISELPQRVIMKWEKSSLPGNPKNIFLSNWLPQNDILAHPNVLAFYSHCGLLGTTEAIYYGVPIVAMPVFGDQPSNAAAVEESGMGVQIQIRDLTKENLLEKFHRVLDPAFREQVKRISKIWHDRPIPPMDSAIYWTEFAARHSNFTFKTPAIKMPLYQFIYLDVIIVLTAVILIVIFSISFTISLLVKNKPGKIKSN